jgi:hypothetical protein
MPLTAANNTVQLNITSTDINGNTSWNRGAGNPTLNGVFGDGVINQNFAIGANGISVPANVYNFYAKNNAAPGSGITVTVIININAGANQTMAVLQPGGLVLMWQVVNGIVASTITGVNFTVAGGVAPIEYFLGG